MRKVLGVLVVLGVFAMVAVPAFAAHIEVQVAKKEGLGSYLTDMGGMTLYWFTKDSPGTSTCTGDCLTKWPIFYRETIVPPFGVKAEEFTTINRPDGMQQTAFRGYPLYYWMNDKPGGTGGQGVGNVWYVIDPANFPPKKAEEGAK